MILVLEVENSMVTKCVSLVNKLLFSLGGHLWQWLFCMNNHNHICMRKACVGLKAVQLVIVQKKRHEHHVNQSLFFLSRYNNHREEINAMIKRTKTNEASCPCLPIDK